MCLEVIQQLKHYKVFVIIRVFTTTKIPVKKQNYKHGRCTFNLKKRPVFKKCVCKLAFFFIFAKWGLVLCLAFHFASDFSLHTS